MKVLILNLNETWMKTFYLKTQNNSEIFIVCILHHLLHIFSITLQHKDFFFNLSSFLECILTISQNVDVSACKYIQIPINTFWSKTHLLNKRLWTIVLFVINQAMQKPFDSCYRSHLHCIIFKRDWKYQTQMHDYINLI